MHDLFSNGICKYGLVEILNFYIYEKQYFTIQDFNDQRKKISKNCLDSELQRMPDISSHFSSKDKRKTVLLKLTSSEMRFLIHYFPLIAGRFIPRGDKVWTYCVALVKLVEMCLKRSFTETEIDKLQEAITMRHELYKKLFNKDLKPKQHFVVHYPSVIRTSGPVEQMMCFRNEANHKNFKQYAHIMSSRKSISYTLYVKASMKFAYDLLNENFLKVELNNNFEFTDNRLRYYFKDIAQLTILNNGFDVMMSKKINYKGTVYKSGSFIALGGKNGLSLYQVVEIVHQNCGYFLITQYWKEGHFDEHYMGFKAIESIPTYKIIDIEEIKNPPIMLHRIEELFYFRLKPSFND
ncbi:uncharacterized protein LOC129729021 isoform X1 [Wyeomyia smithii]|uniref:uncharacterized protein LOC129729021 isoform X1 n=1 Tax=Wyeomyia smithii TaxID=174621 RepID=UPI002467D54C|nr:uncharacterized protein LOC129729021 isoform X1 [Wyeomyia smithii]XP_055543480.1 uncharacterized protein LOC129729021 isoform X1 [Wyeomyia smithii]XP_055543486.1 uncharacterized protein LOC129729021 isoform X1 [Wyeomyia smithii]